MHICRTPVQKAFWTGLLLAALFAGCAGIEPYEPYDYRQDGPKQGLVSGPTGEFVIYRRAAEPAADNEAGSNTDDNAHGEEQKDENAKHSRNPRKDGKQ